MTDRHTPPDPFLHQADGSHRATAPNLHGPELAAFGDRMRVHTADGHTHGPDPRQLRLILSWRDCGHNIYPLAVRDDRGRVRVHDPQAGRFGWAALGPIEWEA